MAAYTANVATVLGNAALATAMGGTAAHVTDGDSFSAVLKCHEASGEIYTLSLSRTRLTLSSYEDDADPHHRRGLGRRRAGAGVTMDPVLGIGIGSAVGFLIVGILRRPGFRPGRGVGALRPRRSSL